MLTYVIESNSGPGQTWRTFVRLRSAADAGERLAQLRVRFPHLSFRCRLTLVSS